MWDRLPGKLVVLIAVGIFVLGAMAGLVFARERVSAASEGVLARHLLASVDAALIVVIALLVVIAIAAVIYAVFYRER